MEYPAESTLWFEALKTGVPVQFTWTQDTLTRYWIGYVVSVTKQTSPQRTNSMEITCVGGSFPLKERVTRVFKQTTIPEAVLKIGNEYGFNVIADAHAQVFEQLLITGNSYWEWMNEQARKIGYGVIVDGMTLAFRPLDKLIDMGFSSAPVMALNDANAPFNTQFLDRTLDKFQVIYGDNVEAGSDYRTVKNVGGVDPTTGQIYVSNSSPQTTGDALRSTVSDVLFSEYRTDRVTNSQIAANSASSGAANLARFTIPATITGQGDPRLRPFGTIYVAGTGTLTDGFWVIKEVTHMFHKIGEYMVNMSVATDGVGDTIVQTPFRTRTDTAVGTVNLNETLIHGSIASFSFDMSKVSLREPIEYSSEYNQGYLKTPSRWRSVG
jgi:phage protein D